MNEVRRPLCATCGKDAFGHEEDHQFVCPWCKTEGPGEVKNYDPVWRDGDVCCSGCGLRLRGYDAG